MRIKTLLFALVLLAAGHSNAAIIDYDVTNIGSTPMGDPIYRFTYTVSGYTFSTGEELEIRFDSSLYGALSNPTASPDFDVLLFQPNNPPGSVGIYSALALTGNPSLIPPFGVDAVYLGAGLPPTQEFFINVFDPVTGNVIPVVEGQTTPGGEIPEPATLGSVGVLLGVIYSWTVRRRRRAA